MQHVDAYKTQIEKIRWELNKNTSSHIKQILKATPYEKTAV